LNIAVIGAGISGNLAARLLSTQHQVTLFEAGGSAGGHTNSVDLALDDARLTVDTGFMVFNHRTYPNFCQLLHLLQVPSRPSDMSFSVRCDRTGLEYNGSSLGGLFSQKRNLFRPYFYQLLTGILRFNAVAQQFAATAGADDDQLTLGSFLRRHRFGDALLQHYLVPMLAAIWSAGPGTVQQLPARFLLGFMRNHGLLQYRNRPQWRTVVGGARTYVDKLLAPLRDRVLLRTPIRRVERHASHVVVEPLTGRPQRFDHVVLATHADQALAMLADASPAERQVLGAFPYQPNRAVLHGDTAQLPRRRRAWASWNYRVTEPQAGPDTAASDRHTACVTYDLNRLQGLPTTRPVLLTLNPRVPIDDRLIYQTIAYRHPAYSLRSVAAQQRWADVNGVCRTWYCGAYWGYGFHEDGVNSALQVAAAFDIGLDDLRFDRATHATAASAVQPPALPSSVQM